MQFGIHLLLGVTFRPFLLSLPFWIPWDGIVRYLGDSRARARQSVRAAASAGM
jgi:hypothetical protein